MYKLFVLGIAETVLSAAQEKILAQCSLLVGTTRFHSLTATLPGHYLSITPLPAALNAISAELKRGNVAVLASGDPLFYGIGRRLLAVFPEKSIQFYPALSSIQRACALMKIPWDDAEITSLHGREAAHLPSLLLRHGKNLILTDTSNRPELIAGQLLHYLRLIGAPNLIKNITMLVAEDLGLPSEKLFRGTLDEAAEHLFSPLNIVCLLVPGMAYSPSYRFGLSENLIEHSRGLITKNEVRAASLHQLQLPRQGIFWDIGAGSGSLSVEAARLQPELITVKGQRLLKEADVVIYTGSLVPKALITGLGAEIHNSAGLNLDEVFALIMQSWQAGKKVVRLHTGDPSIYGAIKEQIALFNTHGIPYAVIPGVSSGLAAAAALRTELTLPEISQTVIFTRRGGRTPVPDKEHLALLAAHQATMMIFLSVGMIDEVVADLLAGGYPEETPVAIVEKVSWPDEKQLRGTLSSIAAQVKEAGITKTALIAVGQVLAEGPPPVLSKLYDDAFTHGYRQGTSQP